MGRALLVCVNVRLAEPRNRPVDFVLIEFIGTKRTDKITADGLAQSRHTCR